MSQEHEKSTSVADPELEARREFIKKAGKAGAAAPAVALLMAASFKSEKAAAQQYGPPDPDPT